MKTTQRRKLTPYQYAHLTHYSKEFRGFSGHEVSTFNRSVVVSKLCAPARSKSNASGEARLLSLYWEFMNSKKLAGLSAAVRQCPKIEPRKFEPANFLKIELAHELLSAACNREFSRANADAEKVKAGRLRDIKLLLEAVIHDELTPAKKT